MIFKTVLLLLCIVLVFPFSNPLCGGKRYKCGLENQANVCVNVSEYRGKVHELSPCPDGQECLWQSALFEKPVYCTTKPAAQLIFPGEGCISNSDCKSNQCTNKVCVGKKTGQQCVDHTECDVGYYCDEFCLEQLQFEDVCSDDYQCENNCVCNLGKCAFYYSLENGIYADNSMACLNGYVHQNGTCQVGPHSQIKGRPCATNDECLLLDTDSKLSGYSQCQCGFNAGGYSYCSLAEGDEEYYEMIQLFQWLLQVNQYCHTTLRFGPCDALYSDEVDNFWKAVKYYLMLPQIQFNDQCIQEIYTSEYWGIGAEQINIIALMISLLLFLLMV